MRRSALAAGSAGLVAVAALGVASAASSATIASFANATAKGIPTYGTAENSPYCLGTMVAIKGSGFVTDGGVTQVMIGGAPAEFVSVGSDSTLYAQIGRG